METSKYLLLARAARKEGNAEDAKKFYDMVRTDDPLNPEAKFFYNYYNVLDSVNGEIANKYARLCSSIVPTLEMIKEIPDEEERANLFSAVMDAFIPMMDNLEDHFHSYGFDVSWAHEGYKSVHRSGTEVMKGLGEKIIILFGEKKPYTDAAVAIWKLRVENRHILSCYRNYKLRGKALWFDRLEEFIQRYEPTYKNPVFKQAGALAFGQDAAMAPQSEPFAEEIIPPWGDAPAPQPVITNEGSPAAGKAPDAGAPAPTVPAGNTTLGGDYAALAQLKSLLDQGIITQKDYDAKKAQILGLGGKQRGGSSGGSDTGAKIWNILLPILAVLACTGLIVNAAICASIWSYVPAMFAVAQYGYIGGFIAMGVCGAGAIACLAITIIQIIKYKGPKGRVVNAIISGALIIGLGITTLALLPPTPSKPESGSVESEYTLVISQRYGGGETKTYPLYTISGSRNNVGIKNLMCLYEKTFTIYKGSEVVAIDWDRCNPEFENRFGWTGSGVGHESSAFTVWNYNNSGSYNFNIEIFENGWIQATDGYLSAAISVIRN